MDALIDLLKSLSLQLIELAKRLKRKLFTMKKGYKIYLLSNYSEELFRKHTREASFMDDIDGKVVSYEIHEGKPDEAIYRYLLDTYGLVASESMFFDDRTENVETARRLGIQAHVIQSQEQLLSLLEEREKEYGR